uniref:Uncharacterized protein n=1 Tax=Rhizophora mucronata TaxID=61149 RepID=A0A2P2IR75_RHIMU
MLLMLERERERVEGTIRERERQRRKGVRHTKEAKSCSFKVLASPRSLTRR